MVCLPLPAHEFNAWGKTVVKQILQSDSKWPLLQPECKWVTFLEQECVKCSYSSRSKGNLQEAGTCWNITMEVSWCLWWQGEGSKGDQRSMTMTQLWRWSLLGAFFIKHHLAVSKISKLPCASRHPAEPQRFLFSLFTLFAIFSSWTYRWPSQLAKPQNRKRSSSSSLIPYLEIMGNLAGNTATGGCNFDTFGLLTLWRSALVTSHLRSTASM